MRDRLQQTLVSVLLVVFAFVSGPVHAGEVAKADLDILGLGLEVDRNPVITGVDVPSNLQTLFGGKKDDEAPAANGLQAVAELTGPGINSPITLFATPGRKFGIPALHEKGEYQLSNIRLVDESGAFLQQASPSFAIINVTDVLKTQVRVRQLTAAELRERGITVDLRNYDVYEYVVIFGVDESFVEIPYPVIVDKRTHKVEPAKKENPYNLPPLSVQRPPRFTPPGIEEFELSGGGGGGESESEGGGGGGPRLPAAIILPSGFGVLHQFFAVIVQVSNTSPEEANIRFDEITATIGAPGQMRVVGVKPAVTIGQPVPIYDSVTGNTYLIAGAQGNAEWTLEALKAGTHPVDVTVEATYIKPGQEPFRLRGKASTAIVVSDPRFQINFSHPDTVRVDENYTAYAFVTNLSPQSQHVMLDLTDIPACSSGLVVDHICRLADTPDKVELDMQPGEMIPVPYHLTSRITGHVFAGAGSANDEAIGVSVKLHMGVSESGIPLSPATLVMPHYARYLPSEFVGANMQLLGLGYSLATAPLNQYTAKFPRVIQSDVFQRAQEIARAGQRIFVTRASAEVDNADEDRDAFFNLSLDLLGNIERTDQFGIAPELTEWDELRRQEKSGRRAEAAMARELERVAFNNARTSQQFVNDFATATSHRTPFLFAYAHGADVSGQSRPYATSVWGMVSEERADVPAEASTGWVRTLANSQLTRLDAGSEKGELALVGRWSQNMRVVVIPQSGSFTLHLIYPDAQNGSQLRADIAITGATPGQPVSVEVMRGSRNLIVRGANGNAQVNVVGQTPLRVLGAAQDMHLNDSARLVSVLFNRPLRVTDASKLRDQFALTINVAKANYAITRKNKPSDPDAPLQIPSAALQQDGRLINVTFDKMLSTNASYVIAIENIEDLLSGGSFAKNDIVPRIDNNAPGGILTGRVLLGDNTPIKQAEVVLNAPGSAQQIEVTDDLGRYMFEFVARDIDRGIYGTYTLDAFANKRTTRAEGAVRLVGEVHTVNLVFLGRGSAKGQVRYSDGEVLPDVTVTIGSVLFHQFRTGRTDANGRFEIGDLPVGPLTFSVADTDGRVTFAANALRAAGEVIEQDLVIERRGFPGTGTVRVTVRRSDTNAVVPGAHVGVYTQGYGLTDATANDQGFVQFTGVPAGLISIIASSWGISPESPGIEMEMKADQTVEQTIIIPVPAPGQTGLATLEGVVTRDDPSSPGDRTKDVPVPNAIITIGKLPPITANADGSYVLNDLSLAVSGRPVVVFDPATGRKGQFSVPSLAPGSNRFSMLLSSANPEGTATIRVRLTSATGAPVNGYRVIEPGFPPEVFVAKGNGIYEMTNVRVPAKMNIAAVPTVESQALYGDQMVFGSARADFNGQVAIADLRLPGQGTIITRIELRQPDEACPVAPCYTQAFGRVAVGWSIWDETEQGTTGKTVILDADQTTQLNTFLKVPAQQQVIIYTDRHPAGFASSNLVLGYEGDLRNVTLRLESVGDVSGRVFAHDRQTPIANAVVELQNDKAVYGKKATASDGSFRFPGIAAGVGFRLVAKYVQDGIYRTGYADGSTPPGGGPVSNLRIILREQSSIEGTIVDANDNPVPLAYYWARELAWPGTEYGSQASPLQADINGRFILNNVFTGPYRITARDPIVQEKRGDLQGTIAFEGDLSQIGVKVRIGDEGTGTIAATVVDSLQAFKRIANAEVTLYRDGRAFDLASTDEQGVVFFNNVPASGSYSLGAYSKAAGRAGRTGAFTLGTNQTVQQQIVLDFLGRVAGFVTDPEATPVDSPVRGMPVQLDSGVVSTRDSTDGEGKFNILGVPEGPFRIFAYDYDTGRMAFGPSNLYIDKVVQEHDNLHLELERTAKLTVKAYLPNDAGGEGELAPMASILVEAVDYFREQQGNSLLYPKMIPRYGYKITARELGGEERYVITHGGWAPGQYEKEHHVVFPSTGTVEVLVLDAQNKPVQDAKVLMNEKTVYTPENGLIVFPGVRFGSVGVQVTKGVSGASASGQLQSRSIPLRFTLNLGTSASIAGRVDAEEGIQQPSVGTRVVLTVTSNLSPTIRLETLTDASGSYLFTGIPIGGTRVSAIYYGPDDTTIGAEQSVQIPDGTNGTYQLPRVKLDATPPRVLSVVPATNATDVSPSSPIVITFSEPIASSFLTTGYFQLHATDDGSQVSTSIVTSLRPDGTYEVKLVPPAPPAGQRFPLKSNVLYRVVVKQGILDTTGNALRAAFGSSFTTVNYTEPAVVRVTPADTQPLASNETLHVKFNKQIDLTSIQPGYGGVIKVERLDTRGGSPVESLPIAINADTTDPTAILIAPMGVAFAESSFYRLTVSNIRDTQVPPNVQKDAKVVDFFSYDTKKPIARIVSPVSAGEKLVSQVSYTVNVTVVDENTNDTPSTDIQYVDFYDANGTWLTRDFNAPFQYELHAPLTETPTTVALRVSATDLSNNPGPTSDPFTWDVVPNAAPANITITNTPASAYPSQSVQSVVTFTDEGVEVTAALRLTGTKLNGQPLDVILGSQLVKRATTTAAWPSATFNYALPLDIQAGTAQIVATVKDLAKTGTASTPIEILNDTIAPEVISFLPKGETHYQFNNQYAIELKVRDAETGISSATFEISNVTGTITPTTHTVDNATGVHTYRYTVTVPPKNADTRITIKATAVDNRNNTKVVTTDVIYDRVDDANVPVAEWITPLDGAALPVNLSNWQTTLRVRATDETKVTAVRFESTALTSPVTVTTPKAGTTDVFESLVTLNFPTDMSSFVIKAIVSDGDPSHDVELPITIDPVTSEATITQSTSVSSITVADYSNKTVVVRGANVRLTINVPLTIPNLIVLDGAIVSAFEETKLDLTIADHLFVDAMSRIDLTDKGYLGGLRSREDGGFTNSSRTGRTIGGTTNGGAVNADASHAGIGGFYQGTSNATYGSITDPVDFGAGGGASPTENRAGANGGGAISIRTTGLGRLVVAGLLRADGGSAVSGGTWTGAAGGSIRITSRALITGYASRITANGGDEGPSAVDDLGGGGGRIAVRVSDRLDASNLTRLLQSHGGRNGTEAAIGGGAGTIFLSRPGATNGELIVSAYDDRYPTSTQRVRGTPLSGDLTFDAVTIGPRALARFDSAYTTPSFTADATAKVVMPNDVPQLSITTTPNANSDVAQSTSIKAFTTASSTVGLREVRTILSVQPTNVVAVPASWPTSITNLQSTISIPSTTQPGQTTLKVVVTDLAGRTTESAPVTFTIVNNSAPVITRFDVTPVDTIYANGTIAITGAATDDVSVTDLSLTSTTGTVSSQSFAAGASVARDFTVAVPKTTPSATNITLTLSANDGFPNRAATTQQKVITVRKDEVAPEVSFVKPTANQSFDEGLNAKFDLEVSAIDREVAVQSVKATFEGQQYTLAPIANRPNVFGITGIPLPSVDGVDPIAKTISITVTDYEPNTTSISQIIYVKPLIDPNAPKIAWTCSSPNALYPAGTTVPIRVYAEGNSANNGVSRVDVTINGNTFTATETSAGSKIYNYNFAIPADATPDTVYDIRVAALSVSGNESTLLGTFTVVGGANVQTYPSNSTIEATDLDFEGKTLVVKSGATLTIVGPHAFGDLIVLDGGKVVQKHADLANASLVTFNRIYVACNGSIDVSSQGFARVTTVAGAGTPDDASGGSHIGRGGLWRRAAGGTYGSIYTPMEAGGGSHSGDPALANSGVGGGIVRMRATSIAIDGAVRANGGTATSWSSAAGGSVWLSATGALTGGGTIEAAGGDQSSHTAGGGGAIALEYGSASGSLLTRITARGGRTSDTRGGGAGSVYLKPAGATFGDLVIDNTGGSTPTVAMTELPSLGTVTVASTSADTVTLSGVRWLQPSLAGHSVRAFAADGSVRGTWRIAQVINDPATLTFNGTADVQTQDTTAYSGYILYSPAKLNNRSFNAVRYASRWEYDDGATFTPFTPAAEDVLVASFTKDTSAITQLATFDCTGGCTSVQGIVAAQLESGEILPNAIGGNNSNNHAMSVGLIDDAELFVHPDSRNRGIVISRGVDAKLKLVVDNNPNTIAPQDRLRGVYRFDSLTLANARVLSRDLVEVTSPIVSDAASSLVINSSAPAIVANNISIQSGINGPTIVGIAGAVTDVDAPPFVVAINRTRGTATSPIAWNHVIESLPGNRGGSSIERIANGNSDATYGTWRAGAFNVIAANASGSLQFAASQTTQQMMVGLAPADTTGAYAEPGTNAFNLLSTGSYEIWANGANVSKNGTYTTRTVFRIEKTPAAMRWFVNGTLVHERVAPSTTLRPDFSFQSASSGQIHSIDFSATANDANVYRAGVAVDGSFRIPIAGQPGDVIALRAYDASFDSFTSDEIVIGAMPANIGVQSLALTPNEITGGRTSSGTVTLRSAAGSEGASVALTSSDASVTVPATITVLPNATTATFTATSTPVTAQKDVTITATYGVANATASLRVVPDTTAPTVTIESPIANAQFNEGSTTTIAVQVTAIDQDSGVNTVIASLDSTNYPLTRTGTTNTWTANIPSPFVEGSTPVAKTLSVTATDFNTNVTTQNVNISIKPTTAGGIPTISFVCGSGDAIYPVGYNAKLRVNAKAPSASNPLQKVEVRITNPAGVATTYTMPLLSGDLYEYTFAIPDVDDGSVYQVHAVATTASGSDNAVDSTITVVKGAAEFKTNTTIAATDTQYDNRSIVVWDNITLTLSGTHTFNRVVALPGSTLRHQTANGATVDRIDITATSVYIACSATVNGNGLGYRGSDGNRVGRTYPGTFTGSYAGSGGTHGGRGGDHDTLGSSTAVTYGSLMDPATPGGAGSGYFYSNCDTCEPGGGILRFTASNTITVDGTIAANGVNNNGGGGGAGGSVRLRAQAIRGVGEIHADGARDGHAAGGGGRVALHYQTSDFDFTKVTAAGGYNGSSDRRKGGAGTVYLRRIDASGAMLNHELIIDNVSSNAWYGSTLANLGNGTLTAVNGAQLTLSAAVPEFVEGSWIELLNPDGTIAEEYEITARTSTTVTVRLPQNGVVNVPINSAYRGAWHFDTITVKREGVLEADSVVTKSIVAGTTSEYAGLKRIRFDADGVVTGRVDALRIDANKLTLTNGTLVQMGNTDTSASVARLDIRVAGDLTIDANSFIDATGRGFIGNLNNVGRTWPGVYNGSRAGAGATHGGRGGDHDTLGAADTVIYGSFMDPATPGASGSGYFYATCATCEPGGGVLNIRAQNIALAGKINANGVLNNGGGGGAGGSIRIDAGTISGSGEVHADGARDGHAGAGGGRIAIYSQTNSLNSLVVTAAGGYNGSSDRRKGGAGTVYLRQVDPSGAEVTDELIVDNLNTPAWYGTTLAGLGSGTIVSVSGNVLTLSNAVPEWIEGSSIELLDATGNVLATYEITARTATTVTVKLASGQSLNIAPNTAYRGLWSIDTITVRRRGILDGTGAFATKRINGGTSTELLRLPQIRVDDATFTGYFSTNEVKARRLTLNNATFMQLGNTDTSADVKRLVIDVSDLLYVDTNSRITATGAGFIGSLSNIGRSWPGVYDGARAGAGGTHGGVGGDHDTLGSASRLTYGSIFDPDTPGGAGSGYFYATCSTCEPGGGVLRIKAKTLLLDGRIESNGVLNNGGGGGAGGSIRIDAESFNGAGEVHADGARDGHSAGGGGRVAVYYNQLGIDPSKFYAAGGYNGSSDRRKGAAGTVLLKSTAQQYGSLYIDNRGTNATNPVIIPSIGVRVATSTTTSSVTTANAGFLAPNTFEGARIFVPTNTALNWPITANTADTLQLDTTTSSLTINAGQTYRGVLMFDSIKIRQAAVYSNDEVIRSTNDIASGSLNVNDGAPQFPAAKQSQIVVDNSVNGDAIVGPAGAVTDANTPIALTVTNTRTGTTVTANANADGSFRIAVTAIVGDTFTIKATDSFPQPLESPTLNVNGAIAEMNTITSIDMQSPVVAGGTATSGSLRLSAPARPTGAVIALQSSSAFATVSQIVVPGGQTSVQFPVNTTAPASNTNVTITATLGTSTKNASFTLTPAQSALLIDVTLASSSTEGGTSINGTVILGAPAPAGGALVTLASTSTQAIVPDTVVVPAGATQTSFTVTTKRVGANHDLRIIATWGASHDADLRLTPCAEMGSVTAPSSSTLNTTWVDDAAPSGATASGDAIFDTTRVAFGSASLHFLPPTSTAIRTYTFSGAAALATTQNDRLALWALVNPCNPPRQILVSWSDGTNTYRVSWGESRITPTLAQINAGAIPTSGQWTRLDALTRALYTSNKNLTGLTIAVDGGEAWFDGIGVATCSLAPNAPPPDSFPANDVVYIDDALPAGVTAVGTWSWDSTQKASGSASHVEGPASGYHQHYYHSNPNPVSVAPGDVFFTYIFLDPCNPPREVMLQWNDGSSWNHRAFWGEDADGSIRTRMGPLPETGKWVRLEVPAAMVGMNELKIYGEAFTLIDGRAWFDRSGKYARVNLALRKPARQSTDYTANDPASRAVDGNVATGHGSMSVTLPNAEQWWEVDLGEVAPMIESVEVRGRTDCCTNQTSDLTILVSDTPITSASLTAARASASSGVGVYRTLAAIGSTFTTHVNRSGRFIRIWRGGSDYLSLPEVLVWAPATKKKVNLAAGRAASTGANMMYQSYYPEYAVNGSAWDTYYTVGNIFHHNSPLSDPYWDVDLGSVQAVSSIDISARNDCCPEQLVDFYVLTSSQPFASNSVTATLADPNVSAWYVGAFKTVAHVSIDRNARYVRLQKAGQYGIVFTEVEVWSQQPNTRLFALPPSAPKVSSTSPATPFDFATAGRRNRAPLAAALR